jgi:hypothetical protein
MRISKKIPAWLPILFAFLAKKDRANARVYKGIMGLIETHWETFVEQHSDPPAPKAKKAKKERQPDPMDDEEQQVAEDSGAAAENGSDGRCKGLTDEELTREHERIEEEARLAAAVREGLRGMPEPLRRSVREAYGPPRTPVTTTAPPAPQAPDAATGGGAGASPKELGPGWRHARRQADDLYRAFKEQASAVGVEETHPMVFSVSGLYSLTKEAIAASARAS